MGLLDKLKKKARRRLQAARRALKERPERRRRSWSSGSTVRRREHIFDEYADDIPNLTKLRENGVCGPLESIVPPITVPAWMCMMTSKDPGTLGIYGFRNRKDHTYDGLRFATSWAIKEPTVWDILSRPARTRIVMSVPPSYPPEAAQGRADRLFPHAERRRGLHLPEGAQGRAQGERRRVHLRHSQLPHRRHPVHPGRGLQDDRSASSRPPTTCCRTSRGTSS